MNAGSLNAVRNPWLAGIRASTPSTAAPAASLISHAVPIAPAPPLDGWKRGVLGGMALLGVAGVLGPSSAVQRPAAAPAQASTVIDARPTMDQTRQRLRAVEQPAWDPAVFSVASSTWAGMQPWPDQGYLHVDVPLPEGTQRVELTANVSHGPNAPMVVIIPGAFADMNDDNVQMLKDLVLAHGMNFVAFDNPLQPAMQMVTPGHLPGNPALEARDYFQTLRALKSHYPKFFEKVSVTGYSYGGLLSVGVLAAQQEWLAGHPGERPVITGSVATMSPPESLVDSMDALERFHHSYDPKTVGSAVLTSMRYKSNLRATDFEHLDGSRLATSPTLATEKSMIDYFGFRADFEHLVEHVDAATGTNALPRNHALATGTPVTAAQDDALRSQQAEMLGHLTYTDYMNTYLARDPWFTDHHASPAESVGAYRYSALLEQVKGSGVPVLTIAAADDFILNPANVADFEKAASAATPSEATVVYPHGGHVGLYLNPQVREAVADFLATPPRIEGRP